MHLKNHVITTNVELNETRAVIYGVKRRYRGLLIFKLRKIVDIKSAFSN